jgi:Phytanoyl-CoA dioxygenase (PhyH)
VGDVLSIDYRTRSDATVEQFDARDWFETRFPELHRGLAARGLRHLGLPPLALDVDGFQRTLLERDGTLVAAGGVADGAIVLGLDAAQFSDFAQDLRTMVAFWTGRDARMDGPDDDFLAWDCVWRALIDGRPVHEPGGVTLDVDLTRAFTPDDDPEAIAEFLREAGFLHLRGWLDPADMATIAEDIDRAVPAYARGDGRSWWATTRDGQDRLVRLQHFHGHSPTTLAILDGPVWERLRQVLGGGVDDLVHRSRDGNCIEALIKPIGVVKGISDVPWHRDCSFGRHTYGCATTTIGISVTAGGEGTGLLRVVAGSHRANVPSSGVAHIQDLPIVPLPTEPGDITVHLGCTLHEGRPPVTGERKVMYTGFQLQVREGAGERDNPQLASLRERAHLLRDQPPSRVTGR